MTADRRDSSLDPAAAGSAGLAEAEARVAAHSAPLKKDFSRLIQHTATIKTPNAGVTATSAKTG